MPEAFVTVTSYDVSALPEGHPDRRLFTLRVSRRQRGGRAGFAISQGAFGEWFTAAGEISQDGPVIFDEAEALEVARRIAPNLHVDTEAGRCTVADALARTYQPRAGVVLDG